ncbi:hypothetical protein [Gemmiger formicilis]|uniref:hypothetical protein n=1 Tax=Gemmiger formicilis TaxID=745368 RepID=UPI0035223BF4
MATIKTIVLMNYDVVVDNRYSVTPSIELGTKDSYGIENIRIVQGDGWSGLETLAVFHAPGGSATKKTVGADGVLEVPAEATADKAGRGKIVFLGLADGVQRISVDLPYSIRDHADIDGDNPGTPTPDVVQQILENSNNAVRVAQAAKDAAENAHRAAEDAAIKAGEEAGGAAASAAAAAASAETANAAKDAAAKHEYAAAESEDNAEAAATAAGESQDAAAQSAQSAAASAAAAAKDAGSIGEAAAKATQEAAAAAGSATAAKESAAAAAASATKAGQSAGTATEKASAAESARAAAESASASASASAKSAADAAKTAGDAATKVIKEGVAEKLTEMQGIQEDVKARQQDVTEKQADVTANVELARQAALSNGYMQMGVDPDTGHLMYTRTTNLKDKLDFAIVNDTNLEVQIHG